MYARISIKPGPGRKRNVSFAEIDSVKHWFSQQKRVRFLVFFDAIKFIYSEKATKFCEIFTLLLSYVLPVKSKVKISQNFVAFSEYMNFK